MTLDADVVRVRCEEIEQSLRRLDAIRSSGREAFLSSADVKDIACYRLLIAIEAALALCYHVSALDQIYRIASAVGLGVLLTVTSFLYQRKRKASS